MLPPGHLAAGFLVAKAVLQITKPAVSAVQSTQLLWWGIFFGLAPDLDFFYDFFKVKKFKYDPNKGNHRNYFSHAPVLWLIAGLLIFFFSTGAFWKTIGLLIWLCPWSHFLLDTIQYGVMWLWPLNKRLYGLHPMIQEQKFESTLSEATTKNFFDYWFLYIKEYSKALKISLICETILVAVTLIFIIYIH